MRNTPLILLLQLTVLLGSTLTRRAHGELVFSADFEAGQVAAEVGSLQFRYDPVRQLQNISPADGTLGSSVLLLDQEVPLENGLSFTWNPTAPVSLGGSGATLSFYFAARRTNGGSKTLFLTGWDRHGRPVFQLVLGDNNAFGNAGGDRQRPGYATSAGAAQVLPEPQPPGSFWWGADSDGDANFNVNKDAHFALSIRSNSWDVVTRAQGGANYSTTILPTFDGAVHDDLALVTVNNGGGTSWGAFWDNLTIEGVPAADLLPVNAIAINPEVTTSRRIDRWGYDIKIIANAGKLTPEVAQDLFVDDGMDLLRTPIFGDDVVPAHPGPGLIIVADYVDNLTAITNTLAANSNALIFASKKLQAGNSFPAWVKDADGNGSDDGNGIVPAKYAIMLADYLRFMEANNVFVDVLGIDNESSENEGGITPEKYKDTIDALRVLATQAPTFTVPRLIGWEGFGPNPDWTIELNNQGWGDRADLFGTHYCPAFRPTHRLALLAPEILPKDFWNTEVHWDFRDPRNEFDEAEAAIGAVFDCIDFGMNAFSWWDYRRTGFRGYMEQALVISTHHAVAVETLDIDGISADKGNFVTRTFRHADSLYLWVLNNRLSVDVPMQHIELLNGTIPADARYTRWTETTTYDAVLPVTNNGTLELAFPRRSFTLIEMPFEPQFAIAQVRRLPSGDLRLLVQCPRMNEPYYLQISGVPSDFSTLPGSTFTPTTNPFEIIVPAPPSAGARLYLRAAIGAEM